MKIEVIETSKGKMFMWTEQHREPHATTMLIPPASDGERIEIFSSDGTITGQGSISWHGASSPHAPIFHGLSRGGDTALVADKFNVGDVLVFEPRYGKTPNPNFEKNLWIELSDMYGSYDHYALYLEGR